MKIDKYITGELVELSKIEIKDIYAGGWISYIRGWIDELAKATGEAICDAACAVGRVCSESINSLPINQL